jgi:hypothetical protein
MFTDEARSSVWEQIRQTDLKVFSAILSPRVFSAAAERAGVALGRGPLNLATLAWLAVSAALRPELSFEGVLANTFRTLSTLGCLPKPKPTRAQRRQAGREAAKAKSAKALEAKAAGPKRSKHDPRVGPEVAPSEEAFKQARAKVPRGYWAALLEVLGEAFEALHGNRLRWNGFRLLVLDGTCLTLDRWKKLGEYFGYARNQYSRKGKKGAKSKGAKSKGGKAAKGGAKRPQARLVMLMLGMVRLPWRYELTPRSQGESTVAARLLGWLRPGDLLLMDRGFFNFGLFRMAREAKAYFAIRRAKRPRLRTLRRISRRERIVRWKPAARKWKRQTIDLRVIDYQVKGFRKGAIVTNLLDEKLVTAEQFLGLSESETWATGRDAGLYGLYHRRWEIETAFREIKRVQGMEGGLRGRTPEAIEYEVAGHLILYLLTRWLIVQAALTHDADTASDTRTRPEARGKAAAQGPQAPQGLDPLRLSFTEAQREVRNAANLLTGRPPRLRRTILDAMLRDIASHRVPWRPGRHYPRPNDGKTRRTGAGHRIRPSKLTRHKA